MAGKVSKIMKLGEMRDFVILRRRDFGNAGFGDLWIYPVKD